MNKLVIFLSIILSVSTFSQTEFWEKKFESKNSIESLAFDSGFYSKSTFYKIFKRVEGITPAEFRLKHQKKIA